MLELSWQCAAAARAEARRAGDDGDIGIAQHAQRTRADEVKGQLELFPASLRPVRALLTWQTRCCDIPDEWDWMEQFQAFMPRLEGYALVDSRDLNPPRLYNSGHCGLRWGRW